MISKSNLKNYIGILFYRHGLFCASNPFTLLTIVISVALLCCTPLANLSLFGSSLEQFKQPISSFDGLEANAEINENIRYERMADRPAWYNRVPIAYIQRIVIKSVFTVPSLAPSASSSPNKSSASTSEYMSNKLYLIDTFRTSIGQLFELNEFIRNFQTEKHQKSLISDLCVHVGELTGTNGEHTKQHQPSASQARPSKPPPFSDPIKHYLPEFNCLYLSPTNFWSNDYNAFVQDDNIMETIKSLSSDTASAEHTSAETATDDSSATTTENGFLFLFNKQKKSLLRELLFGVAWPSTLNLLADDKHLQAKLLNRTSHEQRIVFKYAITIALKKYDKSFIDELRAKLISRFAGENYKSYHKASNRRRPELDLNYFVHELESGNDMDETIVNLQYTRRSFVYYIPYMILYFLLFLYIYISVRKIEFVKSKWGLALAAVVQVIASLFMSIGICSFFGLTPTLNGGEIFPYLVIFIGFENIVVLTKSVVSTPFDLDVRYRIALGLKNESWQITKNLTFELIIIFFGILTMVPAIQEFCVFAYVGLLIDFFLQMIFFVTVLSIDIRRMELSDLNINSQHHNVNHRQLFSTNPTASSGPLFDELANEKKMEKLLKLNALIASSTVKKSKLEEPVETSSTNPIQIKQLPDQQLAYRGNHSHGSNRQSKKNISSRGHKSTHTTSKKYGTYLMNKSVQFFYFWGRTRLIQRAIMSLTVLWIVLICYKSLLVVELMSHDVNVSKETVEALIPKGAGFNKLITDSFKQTIFASKPNSKLSQSSSSSFSLKENKSTVIASWMESFLSLTKKPDTSQEEKTIDFVTSIYDDSNSLAKSDQDWQALNYYHWLKLFANYNVSMYNRYVALLPQINLHRTSISQKELLKHRNVNELKRHYVNTSSYSSLLLDDFNDLDYQKSRDADDRTESKQKTQSSIEDKKTKFSSALFELVVIVLFGIPVIFGLVYTVLMIYKCLCSKKYEEWRRAWSTSNIKRQYKIVHASKSRRRNSNETIDSNDRESESDWSSNESMHDDMESSNDDSNDSYRSSDSLSDLERMKDDEYKVKRQQSAKHHRRRNRPEVLINKIINGKKDEIELMPYNLFNVKTFDLDDNEHEEYIEDEIKLEDEASKENENLKRHNQIDADEDIVFKKHKYPLDLLSCGRSKCATSDVNNQIIVWPLTSSLETSSKHPISVDLSDAVWSMCLSDDDQYLFVGLANGLVRTFGLETKKSSHMYVNHMMPSLQQCGITHMFEIQPNFLSTKLHLSASSSLLLKNVPQTNTQPSGRSYLFLLVRINGFIELVRYNDESSEPSSPRSAGSTEPMRLCELASSSLSSHFYCIHSVRAHLSPILDVYYAQGSDHFLLATQDSQIKFFKIENGNQLVVKFISNEHGLSQITALVIDDESYLNAASGSEDGLICVWNLFTNECLFKISRDDSRTTRARKRRRNYISSASRSNSSSRNNANSIDNSEKQVETDNDLAIVKLEIAKTLLISLSADHQMCIWNRVSGQLIKEFKFVDPLLSRISEMSSTSPSRVRLAHKSGRESESTLANSSSYLGSLWRIIINKPFAFNSVSSTSTGARGRHITLKLPTMCLYSSNILVTGGYSCLFIWNLATGELVKKLQINKSLNKYMIRRRHVSQHGNQSKREHDSNMLSSRATSNFTSQLHVIKQIKLVRANQSTTAGNGDYNQQPNRLLLVTDYTDTIYLIRIPEKIIKSINNNSN